MIKYATIIGNLYDFRKAHNLEKYYSANLEDIIEVFNVSPLSLKYKIGIIDNEIRILLTFQDFSLIPGIFIFIESDSNKLCEYIKDLFKEVVKSNIFNTLSEENKISTEENNIILKENIPILVNLLSKLEKKLDKFLINELSSDVIL